MTTKDQITPLDSPDPRIAFFDDLAPQWDEVGQDPEETVRQVAQWCELLDFRPGEDLLEVGCGTGQLTGWLAAQVAPGRVTAIECLRYELGEPDGSGRRRPVPVDGSAFTMDVDAVIVAIGNNSNPLIKQTTPGLETNRWGNIVVNDDQRTSIPGIYAGGDIVLGAATVILAMGEGRRAAAAINLQLLRRGTA